MTRHIPLRRALTVLLICSGIGACSESSTPPTSPLTPGQALGSKIASQRTFATASENSFAIANCSNRTPAAYTGVFGPKGGTLVFGDNMLIIPGGALHDTVTITATVMDETTSRVELEPHGLQFAKPAGLLLGTTDCQLSDPDYPEIVYLSPTGEVLETIQAVYDPHWHTIASPINHFSGYAMGF